MNKSLLTAFALSAISVVTTKEAEAQTFEIFNPSNFVTPYDTMTYVDKNGQRAEAFMMLSATKSNDEYSKYYSMEADHSITVIATGVDANCDGSIAYDERVVDILNTGKKEPANFSVFQSYQNQINTGMTVQITGAENTLLVFKNEPKKFLKLVKQCIQGEDLYIPSPRFN